VVCAITLPGHVQKVLSLRVLCWPQRGANSPPNSIRAEHLGLLPSLGVIIVRTDGIEEGFEPRRLPEAGTARLRIHRDRVDDPDAEAPGPLLFLHGPCGPA